MFKKDDIVVNKKGQVCKVIDILPNFDVGLGKNTYYVLIPYFNNGNETTKYYIPADKNDALRSALNEEEILKLIDSIPQIKAIWISNPKVRKTKFKNFIILGSQLRYLDL